MLINNTNFFLFYNLIYFFTATLVVVSIISIEINKDFIRQQKIGRILVFIPILFLIPLIGLREFNVGTDTYNYYYLLWVVEEEINFNNEFLFKILADTLKYFDLSYSYFLFIVGSLFILLIYVALDKISKFFHSNVLYLFFAYLSFFFFLSLSINIIRQGASLACLLLAYSYFLRKGNKTKIIFFIFSSLSFHITSIIPIIIFLFSYKSPKFINDRYYYFLFFVCIILSYLNFGLADISPFLTDLLGSNDRKTVYLSGEEFDYDVGFKIQFVVFNTFFLLLASFIKSKILIDLWYNKYSVLIRYYILTSCILFMAFQLPFSDRWGLFSWFVIPLIIAPLFSSKNIKPGIRIHWILMLILIFIGFTFYG